MLAQYFCSIFIFLYILYWRILKNKVLGEPTLVAAWSMRGSGDHRSQAARRTSVLGWVTTQLTLTCAPFGVQTFDTRWGVATLLLLSSGHTEDT